MLVENTKIGEGIGEGLGVEGVGSVGVKGKSPFEVADERLNLRLRPLGDQLDGAILQVADGSFDAEAAGDLTRRSPKKDPLHPPVKADLSLNHEKKPGREEGAPVRG